jgi:hypothetical protein
MDLIEDLYKMDLLHLKYLIDVTLVVETALLLIFVRFNRFHLKPPKPTQLGLWVEVTVPN